MEPQCSQSKDHAKDRVSGGPTRETDNKDGPSSHRTRQLPTATNTLVTSALLDPGTKISVNALQIFLDLLNDPRIDKSTLTLRSAADIFTQRASEHSMIAAQRSRTAISLGKFPSVVLDNIIDYIENDRRFPYPIRETQLTQLRSVVELIRRFDPVWLTLSNMSLVHRSWTWPSQKALGRSLVVIGGSGDILRRAVTSHLFGWWTKSANIVYIPALEYNSRVVRSKYEVAAAVERDTEWAFLLSELLRKVPRITRLSIRFDWSEEASTCLLPSMFAQISTLKGLRHLDISHTPTHVSPLFTGLLARLAGELPKLDCLSVQAWDALVLPSTFTPQTVGGAGHAQMHNDLSARPRPTNIKRVELSVGPRVPLDLAVWLLQADNKGVFPLRSIALSTGVVRDERATATFTAIIDVINPSAVFAPVHTLTLSFPNTPMPSHAIITTILQSCLSLRHLSITHGTPNDVSFIQVFDALPPTLEIFVYSTQLFDSIRASVAAFDLILSTWISTSTFRARHVAFHVLDLRLTHNIIIAQTNSHALTPQGQHVLRNRPMPELPMIKAACRSRDIVCMISWCRKLLRAVRANNPNGQAPPAVADGALAEGAAQAELAGQTDAPFVLVEPPFANANANVNHNGPPNPNAPHPNNDNPPAE